MRDLRNITYRQLNQMVKIMSDEIDREITTKKVTSNSNIPMNGYQVSEQRTSKSSDDNSSSGLILGVLLTLAVGAGAVAYFMSNRPVATPILVPNATDTTKENKSTIIERNNSTIKEVAPATSQPAPKVEINVPPATTQPAPKIEINVPAATTQPTPTPAATAQPQTTTSPRPAN